MRKIVMLICGVMLGLGSQAQQAVKMKAQLTQLTAASVAHGYGCPICLWNSPEPGKCVYHNADLVPDGWYYCKTDITVVNAKPGKCHRCGSELIRMQTGFFTPSQAGYVTVQDTARRRSKTPEETGNDPDQQKQMRQDPDNRLRSKPKTAPAQQDSAAAPGKK